MEYFKILHFNREPFSNSPDPGFFYKADQHVTCLQKLEVSIRLRRGLNVVMGEVGTGKTTLCRRLIGVFDGDETVEPHLIFDPYFSTPLDFLKTVARLFKCIPENGARNEWGIKESIKNFLFYKGVEEEKTVLLIIDEGQKIPLFCLEILREFLNYETNDAKLLQVVVFAQNEFEATLKAQHNFSDRVNELLKLGPLSFNETREMIRFRLDRASERGRSVIKFTYPAMRAIYNATGGYPRKIIHLCHRMLLTLILQNRTKAGYSLVKSCIRGGKTSVPTQLRRVFIAALILALALWAGIETRIIPVEKLFPQDPVLETKVSTAPESPAAEKTETPARQERFPMPLPAAEPEDPHPLPSGDISPPSLTGPSEAEPFDESLVVSAQIPENLGRIGVKRKDMLSAMVARVYGDYTTDRVLKVAEANPHIMDINQVAAGQVLVFPVLDTETGPAGWSGFALKMAETGSLGDAYRFILTAPALNPPLRILSFLLKDGSIIHYVVQARRYEDEASAQKAAQKLPPELASKAEVFGGPADGTIMLSGWP